MQLFTNCIQKATKKTIDLSNTKNSLKCNHFLILLFLIYVLWLNSFMTEAVIIQKPVHLDCFLYNNGLRHERVNLRKSYTVNLRIST